MDVVDHDRNHAMLNTLPSKRALNESASSFGSAAKQREAVDRKVRRDGMDRIASTPEGWFMIAIHKFRGWLSKLRQLTVRGMTASNSTRMPQHQNEKPEEGK